MSQRVPKPLLTVEDVAELLNVRPRWVYEHTDEIPHVRVGRYLRFEPVAISEFIAERRGGPEVNNGGRDAAD